MALLKKLIKGLIIISSVVALAACSSLKSTHNTGRATDGSDANATGAQTSGIDQGGEFNDQSANDQGADDNSQEGLAKRTYYFDFDSNQVNEQDKAAIFANADYLLAHPDKKIILEGHTDPRGSREYNVALGERRAQAVLDLLKSKGINPQQVRIVSYGAEKLAAPGHSEADYQQDRRAIIVYQK